MSFFSPWFHLKHLFSFIDRADEDKTLQTVRRLRVFFKAKGKGQRVGGGSRLVTAQPSLVQSDKVTTNWGQILCGTHLESLVSGILNSRLHKSHPHQSLSLQSNSLHTHEGLTESTCCILSTTLQVVIVPTLNRSRRRNNQQLS